jgi:hypothetical protein
MKDNIDDLNKKASDAVSEIPTESIDAIFSNDQKQFKVDAFIKYKELAEGNYNTAIEKFDTLIVSIGGGGLYVVFESLKFFKEQLKDANYTNVYLTVGGVFFTLSIICNLMSQWTSFSANQSAGNWAKLRIDELKDFKFDKEQMEKHYGRKSKYNSRTRFLNTSSGIFLFAGIIFLVYFNFFVKAQ